MAGATASTDFPTLNPFQPAYGGQLDGFLARLDFEVPVLQPPPATEHFTSTLIGVSAEPPNASSAKGVGRFVLDGNRLTYTVDYSGLNSPPLGAHLHRADLADIPGVVVRGHAGSSVPPGADQLTGEVYLDATALSELANGLFHLDLHTTAFPRGEIRGRVVPGTNEPPSITFVADQAIPLNGSANFAFTVNDAETAAGELVVRMHSSNDRLLPDDRLVLGGAGGSRSLTATPLTGEIGVTTITLELRDAAGASATTAFKLRVWRPNENYDAGIGSLTVSSPASNEVVSGTISWSASARRTSRPEERDAMIAKGCSEEAITNGTCGVQDLTFFVDGEWLSQVGGSDATYQLDTTKLANGPHELTVRAQAWPDTSVWIGVDQRLVIVDNGRIALELRWGRHSHAKRRALARWKPVHSRRRLHPVDDAHERRLEPARHYLAHWRRLTAPSRRELDGQPRLCRLRHALLGHLEPPVLLRRLAAAPHQAADGRLGHVWPAGGHSTQ